MSDVTLPEGYRLTTREEERSVPDDALFRNEVGVWVKSLCCGTAANPRYVYAVPITQHPAAPPAMPEGYRLATEAEMDRLPKGSVCSWNGTNPIWLDCLEGVRRTRSYAVPITASADPKATDTQVGGSHYKGLAIQPAEYCQRNRLPYCEANVVKYVTRHREKNGREDIEKAIHYLHLLLEIEYLKP